MCVDQMGALGCSRDNIAGVQSSGLLCRALRDGNCESFFLFLSTNCRLLLVLPLLFLRRAVKPELQLLRRLSPAGGEERGARGGVVGANPHSATVWERGERRRENGPKRREFAALRDTVRTSFRSNFTDS